MDDMMKSLSEYNAQDGYTIHVLDLNPNSVLKEIEDVSQIEKYTISEQKYNNRQDNFRKFKQKLLADNPDFKNIK